MQNISIILSRIEGSINLGLIARAMANFNCHNLYIVNGVSPTHKQSLDFAAHAEEILHNAYSIDNLSSIRKQFDCIIALSRRTGQFRRQDFILEECRHFLADKSGNIGLLFGNEQTGLTEAELTYADFLCSIPTDPKQSSLNISHAVAVSLYELSKLTPVVSNTSEYSINNSLEPFLSLLEHSYFTSEKQKQRLEPYLKKIFSRGIKNSEDALVIKNLFTRLKGIFQRQV